MPTGTPHALTASLRSPMLASCLADPGTFMHATSLQSTPPTRLGTQIMAVASAVPGGVVGNGPIAERLGGSATWIVSRTGIHERRHAQTPKTASATWPQRR